LKRKRKIVFNTKQLQKNGEQTQTIIQSKEGERKEKTGQIKRIKTLKTNPNISYIPGTISG
jgi:hypothetical protein